MTKTKQKIRKGNELPRVPGSRKIGIPSPDDPIEIAVHLRCNPASNGLPSIEELAAQPLHKRKYLSEQEFETLYGASRDDIDNVKTFAHKHHLEVAGVNVSQRIITLNGTVNSCSSAFGIHFGFFKHPDYTFRAHEGQIKIPRELSDSVEGIFGLDDMPAAKPFVVLPHLETGTPENSLAGKFYPMQLARLYRFPTNATGKGQSIAIIEMGGGYVRKHLNHYFEKVLKMPVPKITDVPVAGGENKPFTGRLDKNSSETLAAYSATAEVYLDIEVAGAVANGAELVVYFAPNTPKGFFQAVKQAVHDPEHNNTVISISWGKEECLWQGDMSLTNAFNQVLHEAAVKGITVCAASGDFGSSDDIHDPDGKAHVNFPASSPFVLTCGGTHLTVENDTIKQETVWKYHVDKLTVENVDIPINMTTSSGGGVSEIFECPSYQVKAGVQPKSVNPGEKSGRGLPDVAGNADRRSGYIIQINDLLVPSGGTSAVAPLYAALIALINEKLNTTVGFINPFLYQAGETMDIFHDITVGDNITAPAGGYTAVQGWDACTGWGSIHGENLLKALQNA